MPRTTQRFFLPSWRYVFAFTLLLFPTAAPQALLDSNALQQLGSMLGFPVDKEDASLEHEQVPKFVKSMHDCFSSNQSSGCLHGYIGGDVNQLRTSLGVIEHQPSSPALHSFNTKRELKNSLAISFNVSLTAGQKYVVRYAMLRVYRERLSAERLASLQQNCSNLSNVSLQLYSQTSTEGDSPVFSLRGVQPLRDNLTQDEWVEFLDLTKMYKSLVETMNSEDGTQTISRVLHTRLRVSGSSSCPDLHPSDFGVVAVTEYEAQLVTFEDNLIKEDFSFSHIMSIIAKDLTRSRRQAEAVLVGSGEAPVVTPDVPDEEPTVPSSATLENPAEYRNSRCQLYRHNISFSSLGWDVVYPPNYTANFCGGHCELSQANSAVNYEKHAFIQSFGNFINPDDIPPPCCVPNPDSYQRLGITIRKESGEIYSRIFDNMIATECMCM